MIYVINLERSPKRWEAMVDAFSNDKLIRVEGVDGWELFGSGDFDDLGKARWLEGKRQDLIDIGVIHHQCKLSPGAVGCNLGHMRAVQRFFNSGEEWGIILEDDVEPTGPGRLEEKIKMPDDCDFFYLPSADHWGDRLRLLPDGRVWLSRTFMGYTINSKAAEIYLDAANKFRYLLDFDISVRCFESLQHLRHKWIPDGVEWSPTFRARGFHTEGYIRHSEHAKKSTMTVHGRKDWIDPHRDIR